MPSTYLTRTQSSSPTNDKIGTMSFWIKRGNISSDHAWVSQIVVPGTDKVMHFSFDNSDDNFKIYQYESSATTIRVSTTRRFRDVSGWYHIVVAFDTTQSTSTDRIKVYVNGVQETSFSDTTYPSQNENIFLTKGTTYNLGGYITTAYSAYSSASLSHFHMIDGTAYDASAFGETDSTTGEWKIKTSPSVTYGTNGFFILKDGNTITDSSTNSNNFSLGGGTLTKTEDCPDNVFATMNPLVPYSSNINFSNGNNTLTDNGGSSGWSTRYGVSTLGMSSGKYYAEAKVAAIGTNQMYAMALLQNLGTITPSSSVGIHGIGYFSTGSIYRGSATQTGLATYTTNDIIGLAFDATNGTAQWYKNGSTVGNPETGLSTDGFWHFVSDFYSTATINLNFGNGYFGTTAVSSAGTNASGIGIFEYDVPTGYTALSTKGLNL